MVIKKFQSKTEELAIEMAKKELGNDLVIMNVKQIQPKGIMRFFSKPLVEVTAALEEERERTISYTDTVKEENNNNKASDFFASILSEKEEENEKKSKESTKANDKNIADKLENLQSLLEKQLQKPQDEKEIDMEAENEAVVMLKLLYNTMIENEINELYANQIISDIDKSYNANTTIDQLLAILYQKMILKFGSSAEIVPAEVGPKIVFFVGPTGVGKTTTIAKIASKFIIEEKKKVVLLTADTYRIAAAEQLRTYANILDAPFRVIYTIEEGKEAFGDFSEYDYILVDTAGHSHNNIEQRDNMKEFLVQLSEGIESEVFLVLSATTKYCDLVGIANSYTNITSYKMIFTKLDETTTFGNLLNLKIYTGAPLSYVTCGQNVPADINKFNPQKTVKLLLGGKQ